VFSPGRGSLARIILAKLKSLQEVVALILSSPFIPTNVPQIREDIISRQEMFQTIVANAFPMVSTKAFKAGERWHITVEAHGDDFKYIARIRDLLGLAPSDVALNVSESAYSHFHLMSHSDSGVNEALQLSEVEVLKFILVHFERLYPCSTILQIYNDKLSSPSVIIVVSCEDAREVTSQEISHIFTKVCTNPSLLQSIKKSMQCVVGTFDEYSGVPIFFGGLKNTVKLCYDVNNCLTRREVVVPDATIIINESRSYTFPSSTIENNGPNIISSNVDRTITSSLSGVVRRSADRSPVFNSRKHFLLTAGHGSLGKPDIVQLTCALANDDVVNEQEALGDKIMRMWPTNLDLTMKEKFFKALYNPSLLGDEDEANYDDQHVKKCVSDIALIPLDSEGFSGLNDVGEIQTIKKYVEFESVTRPTLPHSRDYLGIVSYTGAKTSGSMDVVGRGHRCIVVEGGRIFYQVFYIALASSKTEHGDSGAACFNSNNTLHSFCMGDFKLRFCSLSSTIDVSSSERDDNSDGFTVYGYLTPAHFGLEQAKKFLDGKLGSFDYDFVNITFEG